jgi:hypothetical protein
LVFGSDSLPLQSCATIEVRHLSSLTFKGGRTKESLATTFSSFSEANIPYGFKNKHNAFVGQVVGDGVVIHSDNLINRVTFCFRQSLNSTQFSVQDIARCFLFTLQFVEKLICWNHSYSGSTVLPLERVVESFCANVTNITDISLLPIVRSATWSSDEEESHLESGEKAVLYITASIFAIADIYAIIVTCLIIFSKVFKLYYLFPIGMVPFFTGYNSLSSLYF